MILNNKVVKLIQFHQNIETKRTKYRNSIKHLSIPCFLSKKETQNLGGIRLKIIKIVNVFKSEV